MQFGHGRHQREADHKEAGHGDHALKKPPGSGWTHRPRQLGGTVLDLPRDESRTEYKASDDGNSTDDLVHVERDGLPP